MTSIPLLEEVVVSVPPPELESDVSDDEPVLVLVSLPPLPRLLSLLLLRGREAITTSFFGCKAMAMAKCTGRKERHACSQHYIIYVTCMHTPHMCAHTCLHTYTHTHTHAHW